MEIYGVDLKIGQEHIDYQNIQSIPGEGVILPLLVDEIKGFGNYLLRNGCIDKAKQVWMIYIFLIANTGRGVLSVAYEDGSTSVIQCVGEIDFCDMIAEQ